jgi:C4-dicarboxylate-specific signal transduction histidine kinase
MKEQDEIQRLKDRIEYLEQELRTAKQLTWVGLTASMWAHVTHGQAINISNCVELIRQFEGQGLPERVHTYLDRIDKIAAAIIQMPITPPASSVVSSFNIADFLTEYVRTLNESQISDDLEIRLESRAEARVRVHPDWLRHCINLMVENAQEAMRNSVEKILIIGIASADDDIEIRISDTGPGIASSLRSQIFRKPIEEAKRTGHLGYGLLIAKTIAQAFGGDVWLDDAKRDGASFIISMPKA